MQLPTIAPARLAVLALACLLLAGASAAAAEITFTYRPPAGENPSSVSLRGTMNGWGETAMERAADGSWQVTVDLATGEHLYKFFVDGVWPGNMETDRAGGPLDPQADRYADDGFGGQNAVRVVSRGGSATPAPAPTSAADGGPRPEGSARIHYHRPDGAYEGWGLHVWEQTTESVTWEAPLPPAGRDAFGVYWDVGLADGAAKIGFLIHRGDEKDPGPDQLLELGTHGPEVWITSGRDAMHTAPPDVSRLGLGDLGRQRAYWVDGRTIAWDVFVPPGGRVTLHAAADGGLELEADGVTGGETIALRPLRAGLPDAVRAKFPHLAGLRAFALPDDAAARAPALLRGQLAVGLVDGEGVLRDATGLQIPGVLDDLLAHDGPLGATWDDGVPALRVWAPTARSVRLHLFRSASGGDAEIVPMTEERGVWSAAGRADWKNRYYLYEVEVWAPSTGRVERNLVTDPYSRGLSRNSGRSALVDLDDPSLAPDGWDDVAKPVLAAPEDIVLYELHVRDFSAYEEDLPAELRGTYLAFAQDTHGTRHLRSLAEAGLTHVHLLPVFDIATIDEDRASWADPGDLSRFGPDSEEQQAAVQAVRERDGYNWGYDPWHYGVPEGSYAVDADGGARVREFRAMVQALAGMGLRVVMDVVYNHTNASGQSGRSVLDRIVPGYYHRLSDAGAVETSTCCHNTATEHVMMERLLLDDLEHWARHYKVDGFRFDLMGHHMKRNLVAARDRLHALDPDIYLYGEGWDFGEVQGGKRGTNATQPNLAGTGIGTFNDRIRDAVRGGSPFDDRREQGFATGLHLEPSAYGAGKGSAARPDDLLRLADRVRTGMAGNLRDYRFVGRSGLETRGGEHDNGGYTADPQENVLYVSAHDNETLFDKIQLAAPEGADLADRVRMQKLALSIIALGQGVPFFHAGSELLRSKSMDRDSYDHGDWFNRLDYSGRTANWGVGVPIADKNRERWSIMKPLLADPALRPGPGEIQATLAHFRELLQIRGSSPLFRLRTADDVRQRVRFHNTGRGQVPGLIVMSVDDPGGAAGALDPDRQSVVVVINAAPDERRITAEAFRGRPLALHPVQADGSDPVVRRSAFTPDPGTFRVPGRTAAVFVDPGD